MSRELFILILSIIVLFGLGVRADVETDLRAKACEIVDLEGQLSTEKELVAGLQAQLVPPPWCRPVKNYVVASGVGIRKNPFGGNRSACHQGHDIPAPIGTPVYAVLSGIVAEHYLPPGYHNGVWFGGHRVYGGSILLDHKNELLTRYAHLSESYVKEGQFVKMGQLLGLVGNSGYSTNPHLHFELIISPLRYLNERRLTREIK